MYTKPRCPYCASAREHLTAEGEPFSRDQLNELVDLAEVGVRRLTEIQRSALGESPATP